MRQSWLLLSTLLGLVLGAAQAQATTVFTSNFETGGFASEGWTVVNGAQTNKWCCGTATNNGGTYGAYISDDAGCLTNNFTITATSVSHIYRDVTFPAGETSITLTFDWKGQGESTFDYMQVFLVPTSTTPVAGTQLTSGQIGAVRYNLQATYLTANVTVPCIAAGTTQRLVFSWRNDSSGGTQPPAALDNMSLTTLPVTPLSGNYTIDNTQPTGGTNYASFTAAITALNTNGSAAGGVIFDVVAGQTFTEDPPAIASLCAAGPITFQRSGLGANPLVKPTGTAGTADFGLCISGTDYVTIDGIDVTINSGSAVEYGILVKNASATDGAQNCTVKNAKITLNRTNTSSIGILQTTSTTGGGVVPTAASGANSYNKYYNITIENAYDGMYLFAGSVTYPDLSCEIGTQGGGMTTIGAATANDIGNGSTVSWGIRAASQNSLKIFGATVRNVTVTGAVNAYGIYFDNSLSGTLGTSEIYGCTVRDIKSTSTSTSSVIYGLRADMSTGNVARIYNNDLFGMTPANPASATATQLLRGLCGNTGGSAGTVNFYFNSVRIDQGTALNGTSAAYFSAGGTVNLLNNIVVNVTGAQTTAKHYAAYISSGTVATASNNIYYAPNTNGVLGYAGSVDRTLLEIFAAATSAAAPVDGQEAGSANSNPNFTGAADLTFAGATPAAGSGVSVSGIITDIMGAARSTPPDIGSHETANALSDASSPALSGVVITSGGAPTVSVNLTDNSAAASNATVQLWYRLGSSGAFTGVDADSKPSGVMNGTYTWSTSLSSLAAGTYQFYIGVRDDRGAGQGLWGNPMWTTSFPTSGGWAAADPPNFGTNPASFANIRTFAKTTPLPGGTYLVGSDEPVLKKLTDVATQLNGSTLTGDVIYELKSTYDGTTGETFPIIISQVSTSGGNWTVTIHPQAGAGMRTTSGSLASGALIKLSGADRITLDGREGGAGTTNAWTITNSALTAPCAIWMASLGNGAGATDNVVRNCNINTSSATSATACAIAVSGATIISAGGDNDNATIQSNAFNSSNIGVYANGNAAVSAGGMDNLVVAGNTFSSTGTASPTYGVEVGAALNASVRENTFNLTTTASTAPVGISIETNVSGSTVASNQIQAVATSATGGYGGRGITVGTGAASSNITIVNNFVAGINGSNYSSFGNSSSMGIVIGVIGNSSTLTTTTGGVNVYHNSVNMFGDYSYAASCLTAGLYVGSAASTLNIRNNIIVNSLNNTNGSGTGSKNYAVYSAAASAAYTAISYNDYYVTGTQGLLGYLGGDLITLPAFNTAFTGNPNTPAYNVTPSYASNTNLHVPAGTTSMLESGGTAGTGVAVDVDNEARPGPPGSIYGGATAPDVGADEFDGTLVVQNDMGATAFVDPVNGGTKSVGVPFSPQASFTNLGLNPQTNVTVRYRIVGPSPSETEVYNQTAVIASIASMGTTTVTFSSVTLNAGGTYAIYAASELAGDQVPGNDQITGTIAALAPLSGDYTVGVSAFMQMTGLDLTFERQARKVTREVLEPAGPAPLSVDGKPMVDQIHWTTVMREFEEVTWVPMLNGQVYDRPLRVGRDENSDLPADAGRGVYATLTAAVADLNARGVSGPVRFLLTDSAYPSETFPITINAVSGASAINTVTIGPDSEVTSTISGSVASSALIKLNGADYVIIDGSNSGGTDRSLTLTNSATIAPCAIWIASLGNGAGATDDVVKNCNINASAATTATAYGISASGATIGSAGGDNDNLTIQNNGINSVDIGVYANGNAAVSAGGMDNLVVAGNDFTCNSTLSTVYGVEVANALNASVRENTFNLTTSSSGQPVGISIETNVSNSSVTSNRILAVVTTSSGGYAGRGITVGTGTAGSGISISNNFVAGVNGSNWSSFGNSSAMGIGLGIVGNSSTLTTTTGGIDLYHNSISMTGSMGTGSTTAITAALYVGLNASGLNIRNNIISNTQVGTSATQKDYGVYCAATSAAFTAMSYNDYYVSNSFNPPSAILGYLGGDLTTLAAFNTAFTGNANTPAYNVTPAFTSNTNLHVPAATTTLLESGGTAGTGVAVDVDNEARPGPPGSIYGGATAPDVGADEFDGTPVVENDMGATAFVDPANGGSKNVGVAFSPQASFTNVGTADQTNVTVRYRIVGPSPAETEVYNQTAVIASIASMATTTATFPSATLATGGSYSIYAVAELVGDQQPANDQITGTMLALEPLSGDYTVGVSAFKQVTGLDLTFERQVRKVSREVLEPVDLLDAREGKSGQQTDRIEWKTVVHEVEEVTWVPLSNGQSYEGSLRVLREEDPNLPLDGGRGVYATLTAAVADLNARGVSGPVRFLLTDATYPSETFPIVVNVTSTYVPTASNTVTIKPNTGVTSSISGSSASGALIKVFNTNYITIDGSNSFGGTTRDLTLENTSITTPKVVWFGSSGTTPITNGTLKNCVARNGSTSSSAVVISDGTTAGSAGYFSNMEVRNNKIEKAYIGVYATGGTTPQNGSGLTYAGNEINTSGANAVAYAGLYMQGVNGGLVENNDIGNFETATSQNDFGIWLATGCTNVTVNANRVHDLRYTGTSGYGAKGIAASTGVASANLVIANNMIFNIAGDGDSYSSYGCTYSPVGIYAYGTGQGGIGIYDNSIFLYGNTINYSSGAYSVGIGLDDGSAGDASGNNVVNNLGRLSTIGAGAVAIALESSAAQLTGGDYNNLYCNSTGGGANLVGKIAASDYATLAAWQTASSRDANSIVADPQYVGSTDLHIRQDVVSPVSNDGTTIAGVSSDYDGDLRGATPDIGADEFTVYTLTTAVVGSGSITVAPLQPVYAPGTSVTLTPVPADDCWEFTGWSGDAGGNTNPLVVMMNSNLSITATFTLKTYTITASAGTGGSITPSGEVVVDCGSDQEFTIAADPCYHIADVLVDDVSQGPITSYAFTDVLADHTISASFAIDTFTITTSAGEGGMIAPSGEVVVNCGADQEFIIAADSCYSVTDVVVDGVSQGPLGSYTFTDVQTDHTITASFTFGTSTITASAGPGGSITPSGEIVVNCGDDLELIIAADECYSIADVVVDGVSQGPLASYIFENVQISHTISASFTLDTFTITASAGTGGSIAPEGEVVVNCGEDQEFTITADECYSIADVVVDGVSQGPLGSYTFADVQADHTISATFAFETFTITASAGAGGSIAPSGEIVVDCGDDQSFVMTAADGYQIADVLVDNVSEGPISSYTFNDVQADHTIDVSFAINMYTLTVAVEGGGSVIVDPDLPAYPHGSEVTLTAFEAPGWQFDHWSIRGVDRLTIVAINPLSVVMTGDLEITAVFIDIVAPSIEVTSPNGGETWIALTHHDITWIASDNAGVTAVDLLLSLDSGQNYTVTIATGLPNTGTYDWTVPSLPTDFARVKAVAHDAAANSAADESDADFIIQSDLTAVGEGLAAGEILGVYPNPGTPGDAHVLYRLATAGTVTVNIYDISGRLIRELSDEFFGGGLRMLQWDGKDVNGQSVATGVYFVRMNSSSGAHATKQLVFFRN